MGVRDTSVQPLTGCLFWTDILTATHKSNQLQLLTATVVGHHNTPHITPHLPLALARLSHLKAFLAYTAETSLLDRMIKGIIALRASFLQLSPQLSPPQSFPHSHRRDQLAQLHDQGNHVPSRGLPMGHAKP